MQETTDTPTPETEQAQPESAPAQPKRAKKKDAPPALAPFQLADGVESTDSMNETLGRVKALGRAQKDKIISDHGGEALDVEASDETVDTLAQSYIQNDWYQHYKGEIPVAVAERHTKRIGTSKAKAKGDVAKKTAKKARAAVARAAKPAATKAPKPAAVKQAKPASKAGKAPSAKPKAKKTPAAKKAAGGLRSKPVDAKPSVNLDGKPRKTRTLKPFRLSKQVNVEKITAPQRRAIADFFERKGDDGATARECWNHCLRMNLFPKKDTIKADVSALMSYMKKDGILVKAQ